MRSIVHEHMNDYKDALEDAAHAITLAPNDARLYASRAEMEMETGQRAPARDDLRAAARLGFYQDPDLCDRGAWSLATSEFPEMRDGAVAVVLATRACAGTDWKNWRYIDTLAAAYAEAGDFARAAKWQQYALELNGSDRSGATNDPEGLQGRLWLYRHNQVYRQSELGPEKGNTWRIALGIVVWILVIVGVVTTVRFFRRKSQPVRV